MFLPYPPLHSIRTSPNHEASPPPGLQAALAAGASPPSSWIDPPAPPTNSSAMDTSRDGDFSSFPRDDVPPSPSYHEPQPLVSFFAGASGDPSARDPSPDRSTGASNTPEVPTAPAPTVTTASILPDDRAAATLLLSFGHPHLRIDQAPSNNPLDVIATNLWLPATGAAASLTVSNAPPSASSSFAPRPAASAATSSSERLLSLSAIARRLQRAFPVEEARDPVDEEEEEEEEEDPLQFAEALSPRGVPELPLPEDDGLFDREDMEITVSSAAAPPVTALQGTCFIYSRSYFFSNTDFYFYRARVIAS